MSTIVSAAPLSMESSLQSKDGLALTESNNNNINGDDAMPEHEKLKQVVPNNELDILIKMELANKEMENNTRSAQSIFLSNTSVGSGTSGANNSSPNNSEKLSRRPSFTSGEADSINNDDIIVSKTRDEISWEVWNQIITDWENWRKKKSTQLKDYIRQGIPMYLRPIAWQYLCGANLTDAKDKYKEYLKKQSACEKTIRRDIDRTYPDHDFFRNLAGQESLFNIMKAYSIHDPEVGYCQGSAFICGLLLIQNVPEEEAFAIFVQIMQEYNLREIYKPNMYHLGLCMFQLDSCFQELLPDLHAHFTAHGFHASLYCSSWFLTLFTTALPLPLVCRIFDIFLSEGFEIIFRVGLALLEIHKDNLMLLDMEGMLKYFQKELPAKHELDHDHLIQKAYAVKYNSRKMKKLEKDFSILKKEEQEEQVEMRRLRAENKLLKQRIDNLEKESGSLADRLIKGQVTNAQTAELLDILKNENQKLKDKFIELQNTINTNEQSHRETSSLNNETELLHEKINMLLEENSKLRETPDTQRLEEELVQIKLRDAEAQLAVKELQKTIHVLNLEYQEFLNNRKGAVVSLSQPSAAEAGTNAAATAASKQEFSKQDFQVLEEELLKVKMREAETSSEMKSLNLKLMQLETEKQVAYNQIKRQDEEIRRLNASIQKMTQEKSESKSQLVDYRRQLDAKEALVKELSMTHKLQEAEDAHVIAELRQRVASLEVQIQELVTTGQLNDNEKKFVSLYTSDGGLGISTDKLAEINDDMKSMLMSSNTSLQSEKLNFFQNNKLNLNRSVSSTVTTPPPTATTPTITTATAKANGVINGDSITSMPLSNSSTSLTSIPTALNKSQNSSTSSTATTTSVKQPPTPKLNNSKTSNNESTTNLVVNEYLISDNDDDASDDENAAIISSQRNGSVDNHVDQSLPHTVLNNS